MQVFVDMDGGLADFDTAHEKVTGIRPDQMIGNVDWPAVRAVPDFFLNLLPMPDMRELWAYIERYRPIVLTGVPSSVEAAAENKQAWARKHLGSHVEVRCCRSQDKRLHASFGDVLIDNSEKYRALWIAAGGRWVPHKSAAETIRALRMLGIN